MREPLLRLIQLAEQPTITIQVLPMDRGPHVGLCGTFTLLELPLTGNPTVAYTDGMID